MDFMLAQDAGKFENPAAAPFPKASLIAKSMDSLLYKPANVQEVLDFAEYLSRNYGGLVADTRKAVSYFLTDIRFEPLSGGELSMDELEKYQCYTNTSEVNSLIVEYGTQLCMFGTSVVTAQNKTRRLLVCDSCGGTQDLKAMLDADIVTLDTSKYTFRGCCVHKDCKTGDHSTFKIDDRYDRTTPPKFVFHDLRSISISYNPLSGSTACAIYPAKIPSLQRCLSNQNRRFMLDTQVEVLEALATSQEIILDNEDYFFIETIKPPSYRSIDYGGWGLPLFYSSFQNVMMLILLDAYNRKIITERILPTEIISPAVANRGGSMTDMIQDVINPDDFSKRIQAIIGNSRNGLLESQRVYAFPYPVTYQVIGGDAKNLVAVDLMNFYKEQILDDMGIPPEIRNAGGANMVKGGMGGGLMFFAPSWSYVHAKLDRFVNWVVNRIGRTLNLPEVRAFLEPPTLQQDPAKLQFMMEQLQVGNFSPSTVFRAFGFNMRNEIKMATQDNMWKESWLRQIQKKSEDKDANRQAMAGSAPGATIMQAQQGGGAPPAGGGGMPMGGGPAPLMGGGGDPITGFFQQMGYTPGSLKDPESLGNMAQQIAGAIVSITDKGMVQRIYDRLRNTDRIMYGQVKSYADDIRGQAGSAGKASLQQTS